MCESCLEARFKTYVLLLLLAVGDATHFPCTPLIPGKLTPDSATEVHPAHISVVMAMGDSMTAAFAADSILPLEFRELSFSGGMGSDQHWTLPYLLRQYNSSLIGFSSKRTLPQTPGSGYLQKEADGLNAALTNAHSFQLGLEVQELRNQSRSIPSFHSRWKLLTVFIGANDICDGIQSGFEACDGNSEHASMIADRFEQNLRAALTAIRDSFGKIIVQLVSMFSLASVKQARAGHTWCDARRHLLVECNCLDKPAPGNQGQSSKSGDVSDDQLRKLDATVSMVNDRVHAVALEFNLQRPDFAVVEAVSAKSQRIPDISYLSSLDCFHPSSLAHQAVARALWNGLFDERKTPTPLNSSLPLFCPTSSSVIYTGSAPKSVAVVV